MKEKDLKMEPLAIVARSLVSNRFNWDTIKSTVRNLYITNDQDINKVIEEVKSNPTLKALYKDYILIMFASEHTY